MAIKCDLVPWRIYSVERVKDNHENMANSPENGTVNRDLLEHFKMIDVKVVDQEQEAFTVRVAKFWEKLELKSLLSHLGLLLSLAIYCGVGGVVSWA